MTKKQIVTQLFGQLHKLLDNELKLTLLLGEDMIDPAIADLITQFDAATDRIAARIQALINAPHVSLSVEDKAALQGEVDKLNLLGQDAANPIPPTV